MLSWMVLPAPHQSAHGRGPQDKEEAPCPKNPSSSPSGWAHIGPSPHVAPRSCTFASGVRAEEEATQPWGPTGTALLEGTVSHRDIACGTSDEKDVLVHGRRAGAGVTCHAQAATPLGLQEPSRATALKSPGQLRLWRGATVPTNGAEPPAEPPAKFTGFMRVGVGERAVLRDLQHGS